MCGLVHGHHPETDHLGAHHSTVFRDLEPGNRRSRVVMIQNGGTTIGQEQRVHPLTPAPESEVDAA